jgi:hypothetical protein
LARVAAAPGGEAEGVMSRADELYAIFEQAPDGEHLVVMPCVGGSMPLIGTNRAALEEALRLMVSTPYPIHLVRFSTREVLQTVEPGEMPAARSAPAKGVQ